MGNDLADALIALVADLTPGLLAATSIVCYLAGLAMMGVTAARLLKHAVRFGGGAPPVAMGTAATLIVGIALITLPSWMDATAHSLFGGTPATSTATLGYGGAGAGVEIDALLEAVFAIVAFVGLFAFVRGLFILRAGADGKPSATLGAAAAHLVGGIAAWHIVALIDAVQTTLGIAVLTVS